jgi:hypothetical protein
VALESCNIWLKALLIGNGGLWLAAWHHLANGTMKRKLMAKKNESRSYSSQCNGAKLINI